MKIYDTEQIRNVVLLGHGGCGKTSLVEAAAYVTGVTKRLGKVVDGTTISDFDKEEQKRQFSISATTAALLMYCFPFCALSGHSSTSAINFPFRGGQKHPLNCHPSCALTP